ncbi:MAG: hypothetical protein GPJ54_15765 [Candidatus Heimdallarchaeota archaeon]|nr:hypothetical protein [Candidatus Heimdallarchaeota archaeon]
MKKEVEAGLDPKMPGAVRVTIGLYNTAEEVDELLIVVEQQANKHNKKLLEIIMFNQDLIKLYLVGNSSN